MTGFYQSQEWRRLRAACIARDATCASPGCGARSTHADHIRPRSKGGADVLDNLRGLCASCHNTRSARGNAEPRAKGARSDGTPIDGRHWWNAPQNLSEDLGRDRLGGERRVSFKSGQSGGR